jgi:Dual specificity phosphatase, catalytic domain
LPISTPRRLRDCGIANSQQPVPHTMAIRQRRVLLLVLLVFGAGIVAWLSLFLLQSQYDDTSANYSLIEPHLYMGGDVTTPPRGTSAVLNLSESDDAYRCATHRWEPIRDAAPVPDLAWLRRQVEFIDSERTSGRTVYVHCRNGVSRSGMVVAAYLMFEHHWTRDDALAFARTRRPIVRPNPAFMERLTEWEAELAAQAAVR